MYKYHYEAVYAMGWKEGLNMGTRTTYYHNCATKHADAID